MEDVVTQDQAHRIVANEIGTDGERLSQSVGRRLLCIFKMHPVVAAVATP